MNPLSSDEAAAYWDSRHRRESDLRSGGDITYDENANRLFYLLRLGLLIEITGSYASTVAPLFILDAGCGKGWFSRQLASIGHIVDGIDISESALASARALGGGPHYFCSPLEEWRSPWLYDVVVSIDVLFHILDDLQWRRAVENLASLVRFGGTLIVSDWGDHGEHLFTSYQRVRGPDIYRLVLESLGMRYSGWRPYRFRSNPIGFHVFNRVA